MGIGGDVRGYNLFSYCMNNPVNMSDPTGCWPSWIGKAIAVVAVAVVVVAAVVVTVATCGAGSVAGVAMITGALCIAARATEVAVLQVKKSINDNKSSSGSSPPSGSISSSNSSGGGNGSSGGGSSGEKKSVSDITGDVFEALFDNGKKIIGITPFTKAGGIGTNHIVNNEVSKIFGETATFSSTLKMAGGKVVPWSFAAYNWGQTTISIFSDDPVQRAADRGYKLK